MFKRIHNWLFWWKRSKQAKKAIKEQIALCKRMGPADPPTLEEVEKFKKEWNLGWNSHMVQKVEARQTYFEAYLN